jgi:hypothetical protein
MGFKRGKKTARFDALHENLAGLMISGRFFEKSNGFEGGVPYLAANF